MQFVEIYQELKDLFRLIEEEESPFKISKEGHALIDSLLKKNADLAMYVP